MPVSVVEGLPVSVVEHGLVDGRKTSMVILPHLVRLLMQTEGGVLFFVSSKHWRSKEKGSKSRELAPVCCFDFLSLDFLMFCSILSPSNRP